MAALSITLIGTVDSTERALRVMIEAGLPPRLVLTAPPEKSGINSDYVDLGPVASAQGIPLLRAADINSADVIAKVAKTKPDYIFVIGWSRLCGPNLCATAAGGVLGYHPTLLPKMRGRAALAWTILLAPPETGGTLFWIDEGIDSGPIAAQQAFPLTGRETLSQLYDRQLDALAAMLAGLLARLAAGERPAEPQDHSAATYLALRRPEDGRIDWRDEAADIERLIRAVGRPYPGAFSRLRGDTVRFWRARVVAYPDWHALTGQIFTYDEGRPVIRCGGNTDLLIEEYSRTNAEGGAVEKKLTGQPRFNRMDDGP